MSGTRLLTVLGVFGLVVSVAAAQDYYEQADPPRGEPAVPVAGFWPTQKMVERFIDRLTEGMAEMYDLDEDQLYQTRELIKDRVPSWLDDNRAPIMRLTNDYIEALLAGEPPTPERVAQWADRALPLLHGFTEISRGIAADMRTFMTEEQQAILDTELTAFDTGVQTLNQRLAKWRDGGFDPGTWPGRRKPPPPPPPADPGSQSGQKSLVQVGGDAAEPGPDGGRHSPAQAPGTAQTPAPRPSTPPAPQPKDRWTKYVEDFIRRYKLNEEQQSIAYRILRARQEARDQYVRRNGARIAEVARKLKEAQTDQQRAAAERAARKHTQTVDRMFTQLKDQLDRIPTRTQRVDAARAELKHREEQEPAKAKGDSTPPDKKGDNPRSP